MIDHFETEKKKKNGNEQIVGPNINDIDYNCEISFDCR